MSDLVERLRAVWGDGSDRGKDRTEAAAEIERLRAELTQADAVIWEYARSGPMRIQFRQHRDEALARHAARTGKAEGAGS